MATFRKAERRKSKLRLALAGPSGSGKTLSALLIAYGMAGDWSEIGVADTENGSGDLYANTTKAGVQIGEYNIMTLEPPYQPTKYIEAIKAAEEAGLKVLILDSFSHAWAGEGGLLDQQGKLADRTGNSWAAWRTITPQHNSLVEAILHSKLHVIATMRSKMEHVQTEENGKKVVKKVGMAPIQREGVEYEFTVVLDLAMDHTASVSKDRTSLFDGQIFKPLPDTGKALLGWLESGVDAPPAPAPVVPQPASPRPQQATALAQQGKDRVWTARLNAVNIAYGQAGFGKDRAKVHEHASGVLGREVASLNDCSTEDLTRLQDALRVPASA